MSLGRLQATACGQVLVLSIMQRGGVLVAGYARVELAEADSQWHEVLLVAESVAIGVIRGESAGIAEKIGTAFLLRLFLCDHAKRLWPAANALETNFLQPSYHPARNRRARFAIGIGDVVKEATAFV